MDGALKPLIATQFLTNAAAIYYTAPQGVGNSMAVAHSLVLCNTDASAHTVTLYNVPKGGSRASGNKVFAAVSIPANTTWVGRYPDDGFLVIPGGGTLQALADANSVVTLSVGGKEHL